jgi:predicted GNAT superfamily acetyltransferase
MTAIPQTDEHLTFLTHPHATRSPQVMAAVLALNNRNVPAVNHLSMDDLKAIVDEARLFVVAAETHLLKRDADADDDDDGQATSSIVGYLICMADGAKYSSPNYTYFAKRYGAEKDYLYVDRIVLDEPHHGKGIGRQLYSLVDKLGAEVAAEVGHPIRHLCCEVNVKPRNEQSLAFHSKCGFVEVGQQDVEGGTKTVSMLVRPITAQP